jgi:hypothetical protein
MKSLPWESLQTVLHVWNPLPCSLPPFSLFWLNKSNCSLSCWWFFVFGSLCLVLYLHSLYFDSTNQTIPFPSGGSVYLEAFALFSTSIPLFWLYKFNHSLPCRRFCVFGSLCFVLYLHSLCFDSTNQIISFPAGGSVYLEAFALFSTSILFVLTQPIKLFSCLQAVLRVWKPLPCSLPSFSLF